MAKAIHAGIGLIGAVCALAPGASSARQHPARIIAEARIGLINTRAPKMGPMLVRRGGYTAITDMVRPRFVGGMIDIYPSNKTGFRFSVGDRYFAKTNFWRNAEQATNGLLFDARMVRFGIGLQRRAYSRRTPAALVGYDAELARDLVAGIEGGALFGRAINPGPRRGGSFRTDNQQWHGGLNPIAALSLRYAF